MGKRNMDDIAEIIADLNNIIVIQGEMIEKMTTKLLQYVEIDEIEKMTDKRGEVEEIFNKWKP